VEGGEEGAVIPILHQLWETGRYDGACLCKFIG